MRPHRKHCYCLLTKRQKLIWTIWQNLQKSKDETIKELYGIIFKDPEEDVYYNLDEYLSGNIREKLQTAKDRLKSLEKELNAYNGLDEFKESIEK